MDLIYAIVRGYVKKEWVKTLSAAVRLARQVHTVNTRLMNVHQILVSMAEPA